MSKIKQSEQSVHSQVIKWLRYAFPKVIFHTDFAAGCRLTIGQAIKNKSLQSGSGWPDLFLPHKSGCGKYCGLFIEIKKSRGEVYKKDGGLKKDAHIEEQAAMLARLEANGYKALFGCGFEDCKTIIEEYLKNKTP